MRKRKFSVVKPEIVVALSAAIWGLFWLPLRAFESMGMDPAWVTVGQFIIPLICLLPFAWVRLWRRQATGTEQIITGFLIGGALALYCESLLLTDVVRALILFYVMPAWGTLVEIGFMGRRFTLWRGLSLLLSMAGLLVLLRVGADLDVSLNTGDVMALLSGMIYAVGAMRVRQAQAVSVFEQVFAFFLYGGIFAFALTFLPIPGFGVLPSLSVIQQVVPWMILVSVVFIIPVSWGLFWGNRSVDPGRLGILLQLEAVVGIGSAAIIIDEPFGWREATGALMVLAAGLIEVVANRPQR